MESSPRYVGIEHQAPLVESRNVLNLLSVQLDLHLLIVSNSRWVVHLLEHTHNTLQGLYIELEVPTCSYKSWMWSRCTSLSASLSSS
jgi:hypothetical protein